jgi:hypothetical protein
VDAQRLYTLAVVWTQRLTFPLKNKMKMLITLSKKTTSILHKRDPEKLQQFQHNMYYGSTLL